MEQETANPTEQSTAEVTEQAPPPDQPVQGAAPPEGSPPTGEGLDEQWKFNAEKEMERYFEQMREAASTLNDRGIKNALEDAIFGVIQSEPFYASISRYITKIPTLAIPTMGVSSAKNTLALYYNPLFFKKLTVQQLSFVLRHEFLHIALFHVSTRRKDPHELWNVSTDLAINSMIVDDNLKGVDLPDGLLLPGRNCARNLPEDLPKEIKERAEKFGAIIEALPPMQSSDFYFEKLMQELPKAGIDPNNCMGETGFKGIDDHSGWDQLSDEQRDFIRDKIREMVKRATEKADSSNSWGTVPQALRETLRRLVSNEIDWRRVLRRFVGTRQSSSWRNSMRKINRKYPYIHPGRKRGRTAHIAIAIDQSGSVSDEHLELFFGELQNLSRRTTFTLVPFDHEVATEHVQTWSRNKRMKLERVRCGGTSFDAPTAWANEHKSEIDGLIMLTDGECSAPGPSLMPRIWFIVPGGKLMFETREQVSTLQGNRATHG